MIGKVLSMGFLVPVSLGEEANKATEANKLIKTCYSLHFQNEVVLQVYRATPFTAVFLHHSSDLFVKHHLL